MSAFQAAVAAGRASGHAAMVEGTLRAISTMTVLDQRGSDILVRAATEDINAAISALGLAIEQDGDSEHARYAEKYVSRAAVAGRAIVKALKATATASEVYHLEWACANAEDAIAREDEE